MRLGDEKSFNSFDITQMLEKLCCLTVWLFTDKLWSRCYGTLRDGDPDPHHIWDLISKSLIPTSLNLAFNDKRQLHVKSR